MSATLIAVPRVLEIRPHVLPDVADILADARFALERTLVGTGAGQTGAVAAAVRAGLAAAGACVVVHDAVPTPGGVERLVRAIEEAGAETCIAVGGGRVLDTVKQASSLTETPFVSIPTSLAHDGISSPIASLVAGDGRRLSVGAAMPEAVIVDLDVVRRAPARVTRAGAADLLSNLTALDDWRLAAERGKDTVHGFSALLAEEAARSFLYVATAASALSLEMLARGLVLSGLAMATAGSSRPCSGAEHLISHSLDRLLGERARLHGEQVALGLLIAATAQGSLTAEIERAYEGWALPASYHDLGLDRDLVVEAVVTAPATRPDRYTVLDELDLGRRAVGALVDAAMRPTRPRRAPSRAGAPAGRAPTSASPAAASRARPLPPGNPNAP